MNYVKKIKNGQAPPLEYNIYYVGTYTESFNILLH